MIIEQLRKYKSMFMLTCLLYFFSITGNGQTPGMYQQFTKWYQDPLGIKPLQLSTALGFAWGSAAVAACFIFTKNDSSFQKRFSIYEEAGMGFGYKSPYTNSYQNDIGLMYAVRTWMTVGLGWTIFHFTDEINNTSTFGLRPFVRWYPYRGKKINLFFEYGAGVSYSLNRFPLTGTGWETDTGRTGTRFNLMSKYSMGGELLFSKLWSLQFGMRHFHLSNGNIKGIPRNPSHDCNGFFLGLIYSPGKRTVNKK